LTECVGLQFAAGLSAAPKLHTRDLSGNKMPDGTLQCNLGTLILADLKDLSDVTSHRVMLAIKLIFKGIVV